MTGCPVVTDRAASKTSETFSYDYGLMDFFFQPLQHFKLRKGIQAEDSPREALCTSTWNCDQIQLAPAHHEDEIRFLPADDRHHEALAQTMPSFHQVEEGSPTAVVRNQSDDRQNRM